MLKTEYPTNHLKKEGVDSKIAELSDEIQYIEQAREFSQLKRYRRSDVDSESGSRIKRIDVPGDGSCLFWSVTMAYLIPVRNDDALFRQRYEVLFGNEGAVTQNLDHIRGLVQNLSAANYDDTFANLVRNVFRNRVVDYISSHRNEFRSFVEGDFERYLENMRNPNTWGGEPEIRAMSRILSARISVSGEVETQYGNGNAQIQLFHVGAPGKRNHYNFGLERNIIDNDKELAKGLKRVTGKVRPQDFELIQLLIEEVGTEVGTSKQEEDFRSFETRFQSFVDQIPSYLHSVEKAGFFTHFFLGSFSTLLDTKIAEKLNIKKIYFSFDTSKTLKVAIVKNGQIRNAEDAVNNINLFSISEGKRGHQFTSGELENILKKNIASEELTEQDIKNRIEEIKSEINGKMESKLVQIYKGKDGIFVNMETKGILDSATSKEFHEIEKGVWNNPEGDIEKLANSDKEAAKESLEGILREISKVHSKYENSLIYDSNAREAAHHGFMVGVFMNFHYRYNLRVYPEQFAGRGYADIILLARGPDRALDSIPIIIELKAGEGPNATPDKALQQAERYAQGFQPNVQRVLTTADNILCVGVNLDNPSPISGIKVSNRGEEIIPLFQDMLKSSDDWGTQEIDTNALKKRIKNNIERIYHTFPGTPEKGDNHYFSRFLLGQSLLLNRVEDLETGFKKYIFIYGDNIPTETHHDSGRPGRLAGQSSRKALSTNLDASHAVVTMVLIPENRDKLVYVVNIIEANRKDVLNGLSEELPLDRLNREIGNREIVELNLNFDTRYKSDFKRYLTIWAEKYNSLQEYNNGGERFQGTFKEVPYPNELKETFDKALDVQSLSIRGYSGLLEKIGQGIFPFKALVNKEAHFQGVLNGVFSYYSDLKLQESPETRALVLTEFQTGRGERIDMLVHGIKFVAQGGNAEEYTPIGLELKTSRQGKGAQALLREANDQINEKYKEGVTYKTLTDGDEVKFIGVVFDKGSNNPNKLILTSRTAKEGFIPVGVVHSSVHMLPACSKGKKRGPSSPEYPPSKKPRRERSVSMACVDSFDEEKITEEEKEQLIKELFNADNVVEKVKNIEFYDQLFKVSQKISEGEIIDKNVEEAFVAKIKDVDLNSIDPEIRDIVKEMKDNIENKEEVKNILRRSGVAQKIGKVAEGAGLAFTAFLVGKHIANGDIEGLGYDALNLWVMPKIGEKISGKILELGTKLDSQMLKGFAPVMGRAIGNFAAFLGLAESIKARQNATDPVDMKIADLNIATNSIFIAADVPAVVTEIMSAICMEAGVVGEFAGPVGAAVSVAVIIIAQFVEVGLEVEKLGEHIKLTDQEKHDLYWDFFLGKKVPDYIENDMEAESIYKQYVLKLISQYKDNYDKIVMSLPYILVTKERRGDAEIQLFRVYCRTNTKIVDTKFDFGFNTNVTYPFHISDINSRVIPTNIENYSVVCGPRDSDVKVQVDNPPCTDCVVNGIGSGCDNLYDHSNVLLNRTFEKWFLQEYPSDCYNSVIYRNTNSRGYGSMYHIPSQNANINVVFQEKDILNGDRDRRDKVENRYYFEKSLDSCKVHNPGSNFFYITGKFSCDLGADGQKNIVITQGNLTTDSINIHSIIGSNKANHIKVSYAGYVDGKGGNDVITAKNFTTIKGYFGDSIYGKGLVLLPINFSDIGNITQIDNITTIYNKSGAFISVDKQTSVKTVDGLFVTPIKVDINTGRVTNIHITKLDDNLDSLPKVDNSNFNITQQILSTNYHGTTGSSSNHIFYPDHEHHDFYWKAPSNVSHLYLFDNRNANIMISQANGILDFSLLNSTLNDMPFIEDNKGEIKINKNGLNVTLLSNYKDVAVTFNGEEYYKLQNGELERDYCSHSLKIDGRFSVNGTELLNHHNCFTFDSDKVLFLKLNNDLLLLSDGGALSISNYYSSVHKNWDLSIGLNNRVMEPEEFGERADDFSSFRYYKPDKQGLQIYHNQPINKNDIGLVDLKGKSILDFDMKVMNDTLLLSHKNNTLVKVENWNTYQPAREVMFAFNDATVSNSKCMASTCNSEDVIVEFNKEKKLVLSTEQLFNAVRQNNLDKVRELINQGASINAQEVGIYGKKPIHIAAENNNKNIIEFLLSRGVSIDDTERVGSTPLHYAAWRGGLEAAEFLVDRGASINAADNSGKKPVHVAAENNNKNVIEFLLSKGVSVDEIDKNGWTPLHYTARFSQLEAAQLLVDKGANINAQNVYGREPIHIAAEHDNKNIIELLLNKGVSVNEVDKDGWTPLHWASWSGHLDVVEYLIRKGANINAADNSGKRPVHVAAESNNKNIIEFLLSKGENVNDCGDDYWRPLHYAAKAGSLEAAKFLVENGAGFYSKKYETTDGQAPIHIAAYYGHKSIVKFFVVEKGVDINWEDSYRSHGDWLTPLHWASKGGHLDVVEYLVSLGANIDAQDWYRKTPLDIARGAEHTDIVQYLEERSRDYARGKKAMHFAAENNDMENLRFLVSKGENVNDCGDDYWRPLHYAAKAGSLEAAEFLVEKGAGFYSKKYETTDGQAPIHIAAFHGHKNIVKFFVVEKGVDVNWEDGYRSHGDWLTPLHWASKGGHLDVVEYLVSLGANIDAQDWYRKTPLDIARGAEHTDIVQYLEERSRDYARGKKAMHFAAENNDMENLRFLVSKGENVNDCGDDYWRPLHYAAKAGSLEAAKFLVEKGAGFYSKKYETTDGQAPIHIAAYYGHKSIVKFFVVEKGVDINWEDSYRSHGDWLTPLHWASKGGHLDVVEYLVSLGANIDAQDWYRKTPLDIAIDQKHDNVVGYLKEIKEEREKPVQRNRRYLLSESLDSSGQPEIAASSGTRPSSWLSYLPGLVKSFIGELLSSKSEGTTSSVSQVDGQFAKASISNSSLTGTTLPSDDTDKRQENGGFFRDNIDYVNANIKQMRERQTPVKFKPSSGNIILEMGDHYLSQVDFNGTIMLLDLLIRKVTGQKYISTVDQSISPLEAQGYTLSITKGFEKVVEQAGLKSGVSMHRLNIDFVGMHKEITGKIMSGKFSKISGILNSYVERACPGREAGYPGKLSPKKFDKFMLEFNKGLLNQSIEQILHNRDGRLEVDDTKQMSLEPQSYLSNASVHSHSEVSTCLSEIGVTKLGGNLNR